MRAVCASRLGDPQVKAFFDAFQAEQAVPTANPFDSHEVYGRQLFVNRKDLRRLLRQWDHATPPSADGTLVPHVLVVHGEDGTGRAFSAQLETDHPALLHARHNLGTVYFQQGQFARAEPLRALVHLDCDAQGG